MVCICGHVEEDHNSKTRTCEVEGCLCAGYEEDEDEEVKSND